MKWIYIFLFGLVYSNAKGQEYNKVVLDTIISQSERSNSNALLVYKDNQLVYKNYFGKTVQPIEAMSASKSIVSIAIGLLLDKGFIKTIDTPVYSLYPEWKQGNKKNITIRHLLEHTSGLQNVSNAGIEIEVAPDVIQLALCAELETLPGEAFSYNNKASNLLTGIIKKASGMPIDTFLRRYLFKEMGITQFRWLRDKAGNPLGMSGFQVLPEDLGKIGMLVLNEGQWNGRQLLSKEWIQQMLSPSQGDPYYGFEWWLMYEGQAVVIDEGFINSISPQTDDSTILLIRKLEGRYTKGMDELREKARSMFAREELGRVAKAFASVSQSQWKIENTGGIKGVVASGYLGQYLIIIPEKKIIVVRMITSENFKKIPGNGMLPNLKTLAAAL